MNTPVEISEEKTIQLAANSASKNKNTTASVFQLADNRMPSIGLRNKTIPVKQLKSYQAIADFNTLRTAETGTRQLVRKSPLITTSPRPSTSVAQLAKGVTFTKQQREKMLAANKKKHGGKFHTCTNCGFQHALAHYATFRGRRMGDGQFQIDHIKHASKGGRNLIRNGRVLCGTCNTSRGNRAAAKRTGARKYRALHQKNIAKNYLRRPSKK
ncbi:HNH endonuclease [Flavobacterium circumlabens]|uniref:HNH endonuclease n=1 Tax=Flavobacterium circumlabens TaxID=2133765 RepID=A0A4Y7UFR0_9FLAO|nr:HNH endonuclease signature motif containing protein [Flavobacterium circumlabens]TCN59950.1 HNH endonuclease [Flavobacterium circumlabens]TEB45196.1 HNH endonuclease [Flavobacterium circumlabens]